jgi:hypothetical protein
MPYSVETIRNGIRDSLRQMFAGLADIKAGATAAEAVAAEQALRDASELLREVTGGYELSAAPSDAPADILASAARTTTTDSADQVNAGVWGAVFVLNLTAFTTAASLTLKVQRKNADGTYTDIFTAPAAITALGKYVYVVAPGIGAVASEFAGTGNKALPGDWRVEVVHGNGNSHTYAVGRLFLR